MDSEQTKLLDPILSSFSDLVFVQDHLGRFTYINPIGVRTLGVEPKDCLGQTFIDRGFPREFIKTFAFLRQLVSITGQRQRCEIKLQTVDGARTYENIVNPVLGTDGGISKVISLTRDITQCIQAETARRFFETHYRNLFDLNNDAIFIIDTVTNRLLDANLKAVRQLGYTRAQLKQLLISDIDVPRMASFRQAAQSKLLHDGSLVFEHVLLCKDGTEIFVEISSQVIEYEEQLVYFEFARDITLRKQAEAALQELNQELEIRVEAGTAELRQTNEQLRREIEQHQQTQELLRQAYAKLEQRAASLKTANQKLQKTLEELQLGNRRVGL